MISKQEWEKIFIENFVVRKKKSRFSDFSKSSTNRKKFVRELSHFNSFEKEFIQQINPKDHNVDSIKKLLLEKGSPSECYIISERPDLDGKIDSLVNVLAKVIGHGYGTVVICIPNKLAYYEGEDVGNRYILSK